jgi:hypothetical protein
MKLLGLEFRRISLRLRVLAVIRTHALEHGLSFELAIEDLWAVVVSLGPTDVTSRENGDTEFHAVNAPHGEDDRS